MGEISLASRKENTSFPSPTFHPRWQEPRWLNCFQMLLSDWARGQASRALSWMEMVISHSSLLPPPSTSAVLKIKPCHGSLGSAPSDLTSEEKPLETRSKCKSRREIKKNNKKKEEPEYPRKSLYNLILQDKWAQVGEVNSYLLTAYFFSSWWLSRDTRAIFSCMIQIWEARRLNTDLR